ncbi:MAG: type 1 glutamine amidotransferase [Deltaproteobacteria bacterium]|nr:type 1 glutamine amidotransferase [Deltaproteobacteria bacterium]MBW2413885.1 type 1 glutamine amidotransferase [Deltaproteobacteria bacterium]
MRLLVLDGYSSAGRAVLTGCGATEAGRLFERELLRIAPECHIDIAFAAEATGGFPRGVGLAGYDGVLWTGSSLSVLDVSDPHVSRQIDLARAVQRADLPVFGSCWGAQVSAVAAGGRCRRIPKGREFGVGRAIELNQAGRAHPLFRGKPDAFDVLTCHEDEVEVLPDCARLLASNGFSRVQALTVGRFWAVQYHPEYDLNEIASLARLRSDRLVAEGQFADDGAVRAWADGLDALHADPSQVALAASLGVPESLLDPDQRTLELRNWLESLSSG